MKTAATKAVAKSQLFIEEGSDKVPDLGICLL
jgi:hypothetical protein